jgi:alkyl hydroperoxide reductase subunit AhpF
MPLLNDRDRDSVRDMLAAVTSPVILRFFTRTFGCESCEVARQILDEIASLSDNISIDEVNVVLDKEKAAGHDEERVPAIAIVTDRDTGIRFYGVPSGYEFMSLLDAIILASNAGESQLNESSLALVGAVKEPVSIQVFVTPT